MVPLEIRETVLCSFFRMLWIIKWFTVYFYGCKYLNKLHNSGVLLIFVILQIFLISHNIFNDFHQYVQWPTNLKRIWSMDQWGPASPAGLASNISLQKLYYFRNLQTEFFSWIAESVPGTMPNPPIDVSTHCTRIPILTTLSHDLWRTCVHRGVQLIKMEH